MLSNNASIVDADILILESDMMYKRGPFSATLQKGFLSLF